MMWAEIDWTELSLQLVVTFCHFLWQGCLVAMVLAILLAIARRNARMSYLLACAAFFTLPLFVVVTFALVYHSRETVIVKQLDKVSETSFHGVAGNSQPATSDDDFSPNINSRWIGNETRASDRSLPTRPPNGDLEIQLTRTPRQIESESLWSDQIERWAPYILIAYLTCVLAMLSRLSVSIVGSSRLRRDVRPLDDQNLLRALGQQAARLGLKQIPVVALCRQVRVPVVVGVLKPLVLLPPAMLIGLDVPQLSAILAHELAHIRRHDLIVNLLQRVVESILFFHPAMWWISRQVRIEREKCCDDLASGDVGNLRYASALLQMAELCIGCDGGRANALASLSADGGNSSEFGRRVRRLIQSDESPRLMVSPRSFLTGLVGTIFLTAGMVTWGFSQHPLTGKQTEDRATPKSATNMTFPKQFADALITCLKTREPRDKNGPHFIDEKFLNELRVNTVAFLTAKVSVDPNPELQQDIIDSMTRRVTDPNDPTYYRFGSYLGFGNAFKDLMWRVHAAATRPELSPEERATLEAQRQKLRGFVKLVDEQDVPKFDALLADPLSQSLHLPLSEEAFAKLWGQTQGSSVGGLCAVNTAVQRMVTEAAPPWPDRIIGSGGPTGNRSHEFASEEVFLGASEQLGSIEDEKAPGVVHLDQAKLLTWPKNDVPDLAALLIRTAEHGAGDVGYSPSRDELIAFRSGKLLKLDTSDWNTVDQMTDDELRAKIEKDGTATLSMAEYPKHGFRAVAPDPPLIAMRRGPFDDGSGNLYVFAIDAGDIGMYLGVRPRPVPRRTLDLLKIPPAMAQTYGHPWHGLRTSLTLADPDRSKLNLGQVLVNLDLLNESPFPQHVALDPAGTTNSFTIYGPDGKQITGLMGGMPSNVPRDANDMVIPRTVQPGESIRLLENFNLGLACYFPSPGWYQITFGGQERSLSLGTYGRSYSASNLLTINIAAGPRPLIHQVWELFYGQQIDNGLEAHKSIWLGSEGPIRGVVHPHMADPHTLAFRRSDYEYTNFVILTFTDSADPVPETKWTPWSIKVNRPWPKPRDVLLGKTDLGFAHLLIPPLADEEWPLCEKQFRGRLGERLTPVATPK
jgi:beta-lactamase regulating signal transducer with metallopeptidase domain